MGRACNSRCLWKVVVAVVIRTCPDWMDEPTETVKTVVGTVGKNPKTWLEDVVHGSWISRP